MTCLHHVAARLLAGLRRFLKAQFPLVAWMPERRELDLGGLAPCRWYNWARVGSGCSRIPSRIVISRRPCVIFDTRRPGGCRARLHGESGSVPDESQPGQFPGAWRFQRDVRLVPAHQAPGRANLANRRT
jgi:hypothetical protein